MARSSRPTRRPGLAGCRALARRPGLVRTAALASALVLSTSALAACSDDGDVLTVYSGRTSDLIGPLLDQFAEETGTDIEVRYGDSADLALLLDEEGEQTPADVFISQAPGPMGFVDSRGALAPLPDDILDLVPERYRAADGDWVGLSARKRVLVYNTEMIDEADLPASVFDLTSPEYAGQVAVAPANGSFQDFVSAMRIELGDEATSEWLAGMAANDSPSYANNVAIVEAVGRGEVPMGLVNHYYNGRALDEDPDLPSRNHDLAGDDLGSLILLTTAGQLAASDQPEVAQQLITFLLSPESQEYFAEETFEYPVVDGVEPLPELPPLEGTTGVDFSELGDDLSTTLVLIDESGIEQ